MAIADPLTIEESARLVSRWEWAEARLYEVLGGWAAVAMGPAAKIYFDVCSQHHAWRARLWEERRPGLPAHLVPEYDGARTAIDELTALTDDVGRLSAYSRVVLPRVILGYRSWQERCSVAPDQPVARALGFALADVMSDWERGSALLTAHLSGEGAEVGAVSAASALAPTRRAAGPQGLTARRLAFPATGRARLTTRTGCPGREGSVWPPGQLRCQACSRNYCSSH